jgi:hypothetical protein
MFASKLVYMFVMVLLPRLVVVRMGWVFLDVWWVREKRLVGVKQDVSFVVVCCFDADGSYRRFLECFEMF